jgi:hypothetical protein
MPTPRVGGETYEAPIHPLTSLFEHLTLGEEKETD